MLPFRRRLFRRNGLPVEVVHKPLEIILPEPKPENITQENRNTYTNFGLHMTGYIGKTVTIFVSSGGVSGMGFTGVLIYANDSYIQLITRIGPAPACSLYNTCLQQYNTPYVNSLYSALSSFVPVPTGTVGSIACIPADKIAAFVHNAV